ncbi:MAG: hypothetical protein OXI55_01070 [Gammaproteobacteria bacterium]|nr:hypothetical protein [Gammaproteobacteria bacterium]
MTKIDWRFPPTGGGVEAGINDAGIVTFDGAPLASLAREVLQNSVDARASADRSVHVTFEIREVARSDFGGAILAEHIESCATAWQHDAKAARTFDRAREVLKSETVPVLGIIDSNTTGLAGDAWRGLVKTTGASFKSSEFAGGSFGVGKAAPFTLSPLRTVFYWSSFEQDGATVERLQGKAVLVSHDHDFGNGPEMTQATGFFGTVPDCEALAGNQIPVSLRPTSKPGEAGTAVWVMAFEPSQAGARWQQAIARSVIVNFFYAIEKGDLEVLLEPDEGDGSDSDWEIKGTTIGHQFAKLVNEDDELVRRSSLYWNLTKLDPVEVWNDEDLGSVKLWIGTEDDFPDVDSFPNRTALIRRTGMLITDEQQGHRFRGLRDYVAVCVFDDEEGNELLRRMENPSHNQFEYSRLHTDDEKRRGRRALDRLRRWIREMLRQHASQKLAEVSDDVEELVDFLYTDQPGAFDDDTSRDGQPSFGEVGGIRRKPPRTRVRVASPLAIEEGEHEGDAGDDGGDAGGGDDGKGEGGNVPGTGGTRGTGDGLGTGGSGPKGGSKGGRRPIELTDVRVIVDPADTTRARVAFTATESVVGTVLAEEVGDSSAIKREDVLLLDDEGAEVAEVGLVTGRRHTLRLEGEADLNAAWQIRAYAKESEG